jgi:predicted glycosyltransferase
MSTAAQLSRVLLYSHDTYGLGHLRRNLVLARHLLASARPPRVLLATGSPVIGQVTLPRGLAYVPLPPVIKTGADEYDSLDPLLGISLVRRARTAVLSDVVVRWKPDVLVVDHAPHGMKAELLPVFDALSRQSPPTRVVLGLRDILDEPERVAASWRAEGVVETLERVYDAILVYGERSVFDLERLYRLPRSVAERLEYCGYVAGAPSHEPIVPPGLASGTEYVLGTVGGGGDGVEVLLATVQAASAAGLAAVLCTGPLMPAADRAYLRDFVGAQRGVVVVEHLADVAAMAGGARCVVTRGGYNSMCEMVDLGVPTVVVPRSAPRLEQVLRAEAFERRGLVRVVKEGPGMVGRLARAVAIAAGEPARPHGQLDLDGGARMVEALRRLVDGRAADGRVLRSSTTHSRVAVPCDLSREALGVPA